MIEDLAETFSGLTHIGDPLSDLSFLSFGSIKVATAFGGGVARVRDRAVWERMASSQEQLSVQSRNTFLMKCVKNTPAMMVLNIPAITAGMLHIARQINWDLQASVVSMMRGFPGDQLMQRLREQPSAALLSVLLRRLANLDESKFQLHQDCCDLFIDLLPSAPACSVPGFRAEVRNHWLLPVVIGGGNGGAVGENTVAGAAGASGAPSSSTTVDNGVEIVAQALKLLNDNGIAVYRGTTQLALVPTPPEGCSDLTSPPTVAADMMSRTLYLPVHRGVPEKDIVRMALIMHKVVEQIEKQHGKPQASTQIRSKL